MDCFLHSETSSQNCLLLSEVQKPFSNVLRHNPKVEPQPKEKEFANRYIGAKKTIEDEGQ
jgi:hypothetical protein